jgi:hypothetical protein
MKNNEKMKMEECTCGHVHKRYIWIMGLMIIILLIGEWMIYRNQLKINKMMSEGFMQIKENSIIDNRGTRRMMQPNNVILQEGQGQRMMNPTEGIIVPDQLFQ